MKAERDCTEKPKLLETHFAPTDLRFKRALFYEPSGVRFWLGKEEKGQVGLYSYFTLIGDFEIVANYEWLCETDPKTGYGLSCGLAVEYKSPKDDKMVQIARGIQIGRGHGYYITEKLPPKGEQPQYGSPDPRSTVAKKGRLALRREKDTVICLAADEDETLEEVGRVKFVTHAVQKARLFADPGGEIHFVDARLSNIRLRAEQIESDIPEHERQSNIGWWIMAAAIAATTCLAGVVIYRRWKGE
jgi:hypothetical protein